MESHTNSSMFWIMHLFHLACSFKLLAPCYAACSSLVNRENYG